MLNKLGARDGDDLNMRLKINDIIDDVNWMVRKLRTLEANMLNGIREKESDKKDCIVLKPCPHCGGDDDDLSVSDMVFDEVSSYSKKGLHDGMETRQFVYCSCCGHYGDLDTWNDRVKNGGG